MQGSSLVKVGCFVIFEKITYICGKFFHVICNIRKWPVCEARSFFYQKVWYCQILVVPLPT